MEELKFRAQQYNHGKHGFQYGSYATDNKDYHAIIKENKSNPCEMYNVTINPDTLGQYTTLKDDEGKELYAGDIVCISGSGNCIVGISPIHGVTYTCIADDALSTCAHDVIAEQENIFLVGNIHENPELLGEK